KYLVDVNAKAVEHLGCCGFTTAKDAMISIVLTIQSEHRDCLIERVNNPVFWDTRFGVVDALELHVTFRVIWADDFENSIGTEPAGLLIARVVWVEHQHDIRLPLLAGPDLET